MVAAIGHKKRIVFRGSPIECPKSFRRRMKPDYVSVRQIIEFTGNAYDARKVGDFRECLDAIITDNHHPIDPCIDSKLKLFLRTDNCKIDCQAFFRFKLISKTHD